MCAIEIWAYIRHFEAPCWVFNVAVVSNILFSNCRSTSCALVNATWLNFVIQYSSAPRKTSLKIKYRQEPVMCNFVLCILSLETLSDAHVIQVELVSSLLLPKFTRDSYLVRDTKRCANISMRNEGGTLSLQT